LSTIPTAAALDAALQAAFAPSFLEVRDDSAQHAWHAGANGLGHGTHFHITISAARFAGLSRVAAHRLVYDALSPYFEAGLHALAIDIRR